MQDPSDFDPETLVGGTARLRHVEKISGLGGPEQVAHFARRVRGSPAKQGCTWKCGVVRLPEKGK